MSQSPQPGQGSPDLMRYLHQLEKKRVYNREYYQSKIKPKKEQEKEELSLLRDRCAILETQSKIQEEYVELAEKYNDLLSQFNKVQEMNTALSRALEEARQKNYELMMAKADQFLPPLKTKL